MSNQEEDSRADPVGLEEVTGEREVWVVPPPRIIGR